MFTSLNACTLIALLLTASTVLGQPVATSQVNTGVADLIEKTFAWKEDGEVSESHKTLELLFLFHKDNRATFRTKKGERVKDSPLGWRFVGDSLYLQPAPISMEADGEVQQINRSPRAIASTMKLCE